ncbi:MAG TPA: hypothetical protein VF017_10840 [Thermoanaerobaculia bacterium]|nr:hypothetical protein [Thermoanaerobaculia bacterium]
MRTRVLLAGFFGILTLFSASSAAAAILRTADGTEITGELAAESFQLETDAGPVEVPLAAILQAKRAGDRFEILLADGTKLLGTITEESVKIKEGLILKAIPTAQIEILMFTPPGFPLGSLKSNYFPVALYKGKELVTACPIRLEIDVTKALRAGKGEQSAIARTGFFTCDSLSIVTLSVSLDRGKRSARVTFSGTIRVLESSDKWAQINAELLAGGKALVRPQGARIDAEEKKGTPFKLSLEVPTATLDAVLAEAEGVLARISVEVSRN